MDFSSVMQTALKHSGDSGDESIFQNALSFLQENHGQIAQGNVDERAAIQSHQKVEEGNEQHDADSLGMAAGVSALKAFTGSGQGSGPDLGEVGTLLGGLLGGAGGQQQGQNAFVGLAMAQASKMFDQQSANGNVAPGSSKQDVVTKAGEFAMKMYMKQAMGGSGGGAGGLMNIASQFLK